MSRVVWSEGMYLGPQHFQAQSRYFEDSVQFAIAGLSFRPYGVIGCKFDPDALRNGTLSLTHARGVFPDGLAFHMPECDRLPATRSIAGLFPPARDRAIVSLAVPSRRPEGANCSLGENGAGDLRYLAEARSFYDENTGRDERSVKLGRKNIRLLLDSEPADGLVSLPLARVMRDGAGHFVYDPAYIPPALQISASETLMLLLRRLLEILEEKSATLSRASGDSGGARDFSSGEIGRFWLLHAVNAALAPLRHQWIAKRGHPEELFVELSRLAGALCTFSLDSHPRTLPLYDHENLGECFDVLDRHIRAHLETVIPANCLSVPLSSAGDYFWEGDLADSRCFGRSQWILALRADAGEAELISKTPQLVKICSAKFVGELVRRALPGLPLTHLPVPPPAVSARVETQYFSIARTGPFWDHIAQTRRVGIYVPGDLPRPELELLVVLD